MAGCAVPAASPSAAPKVGASAGGGQPTPEASEPVPLATSTARPDVTSGPTAAPTARPASTLAGNQLTEVIVDELIARSAPGTGSDSEIYPGTIAEGTRLWLYNGPVTAAGYEWYHVVSQHGTLLEPVAGRPFLDAWARRASPRSQPSQAPHDFCVSATNRSDSRGGSIRCTVPVVVADRSRDGSPASWPNCCWCRSSHRQLR
jgi:hypothetical protein